MDIICQNTWFLSGKLVPHLCVVGSVAECSAASRMFGSTTCVLEADIMFDLTHIPADFADSLLVKVQGERKEGYYKIREQSLMNTLPSDLIEVYRKYFSDKPHQILDSGRNEFVSALDVK